MKKFRVGVDSYSIGPLKLSPFEALDWAHRNNADGLHFTEVNLKENEVLDKAYLTDLAQYADGKNLYLEWGGCQHIPFDTMTWQPVDLVKINRKAAEEANVLGATIIRSCSGGLMRWRDNSPATESLLREMARALKPQKQMFNDLHVVLGIELHFEFTTFELLKLFDMCDAEPGDFLGVCLDTMNLLTMLEDPVMGTERILPWVVATHCKDGGILLNEQGFVSFTAQAGTGIVDWDKVLRRLATLKREINLSIEDHGGSFDIPIFDPTFLSRFPDLTTLEMSRLLRLAQETAARVNRGEIGILPRPEWPKNCEGRMRKGIQSLKRIVDELSE
ncbi:MAG: sugar phosphate isomerase/epimerase family protein [Candidatus Zhuqueibacterota bacterium]